MRDRWWEEAACDGVDTELFFPNLRRGPNNRNSLPKVIYEYCLKCPVMHECLEDELKFTRDSVYHSYGVWGGTTEPMRQEIMQRRQRSNYAS